MLDHAYEPVTLLPYLSLLVESIRFLIWPIVTLACAIRFLPLIPKLLPRLRKLSGVGFDAEFGPSQETIDATEMQSTNHIDYFQIPQKSQPIIKLEALIREDVHRVGYRASVEPLIYFLA